MPCLEHKNLRKLGFAMKTTNILPSSIGRRSALPPLSLKKDRLRPQSSPAFSFLSVNCRGIMELVKAVHFIEGSKKDSQTRSIRRDWRRRAEFSFPVSALAVPRKFEFGANFV